jgi:hypothetical protein
MPARFPFAKGEPIGGKRKGAQQGENMLLYHFTPKVNQKSIEKQGLLVSYATGSVFRVWLCDKSRLQWAKEHIYQHQGKRELVLFKVHVELRRLRETREGIFFTTEPIPAGCLKCITS